MLYDVVHSSLAAAAPERAGTLGFLYNHGGLNNQKMAIVGLFLAAIEQRAPINLPYIYVKDQRTDDEYLAKFEDVFDRGAVEAFARRHAIAIGDGTPSGARGGWEYFERFCKVLASGSVREAIAPLLDALTSLQPRIASHKALLRLKDFVRVSLGIDAAIQLRIEHDWQVHAQNLRATLGDREDYGIGFQAILAKVAKSFPDLRVAYVTADETSLPASKDEIRRASRERFGIDLMWKSDLLDEADVATFNPLDLSIIDYEMARSFPRFVGQTASTFANMLCLEKFARTRKDVTGHFIYNCLGDEVEQRQDNGFTAAADAALQPPRVGEADLSADAARG